MTREEIQAEIENLDEHIVALEAEGDYPDIVATYRRERAALIDALS